jgi:cytidylate kinase
VTPAVVAVDGPAGAGKSSASRALADRLGFAHVDTGAMYRVVGVLARERGIAPDDPMALEGLVRDLRIDFGGGGARVLAGGRDLSEAIRRPEAGEWASRVSAQPVVRQRLVALQRALGRAGGIVMEGRDIGTVVFPDAPVKFYLTADPAARARRRAAELRGQGEPVDEAALVRELGERDRRDAGRAHSPLRAATDAVVIDTTPLPLTAVVDLMERVARERGVGRP